MTSLKRLLSSRYPVFLARAVLGAVFIVASVEKIMSPDVFAISVEAYRILPFPLINLFALVVPWLELFCGVFLLAGHRVRGSALISGVLLGGFTLAMVSALARRLTIDCGCFGAAYQSPIGWARVLEDLGLLVLAVYVFRFWPSGGSGLVPETADSAGQAKGPESS